MTESIAPTSGAQAPLDTPPRPRDGQQSDVRRDVARNLGAFAAAAFAVRLGGLAAIAVVARALSSGDFGRYSVALAVSSLFAVFVESGMGGYLVREGTRAPERAAVALGHVVLLQTAIGVLAVALCLLTSVLLGYDRTTQITTILLAVGAVVQITQRSFLALLSALNQARSYAAFQSGQAFVITVTTVIAALAGWGPVGIAAAVLLTSIASFPMANWTLRRHWEGRIRFVTAGLRETLHAAAAYSATKVGVALLTYLDAVLVQAMKGNVAAAQYGSSYRLMMAVRMVQQIYSDGLAQPAARLAKEDRRELQEVLTRSMSQLFVAGLGLGIGGFLLSDRIMAAIFGAPYAAAGTAAGLLFLTIPMSFACQPCIITALAMGLERRVAQIFGVTVLVNLITNLALIPKYGPAGAAATMILSTVVLYGSAMRLLWVNGIRFPIGRRVLKTCAAAAVMAVVVVAAEPLPLAAVVLLGAAAYLAMIRALRTLDAVDLTLMPMGRRLRFLVRS